MSQHDDPYGAVVTWVDRPPLPGPLQGLRVGIKDLIAVAGVPRLCGAPGMVDPTPQPRDAAVVERLVTAGARIVATTATHEFGWGVVTPTTRNPRAPDRIAGGSSGGSAAALAAGIIDGALGSDTAGSIRIPAACCGVVGLRPTHARLPLDGVQPLAPTFDSVGPMARDIATVGTLYAALAGEQPFAPASGQLRVGLIRGVTDGPLDPQIRQALVEVAGRLPSPATTVDLGLQDLTRAHAATSVILAAEERKVHSRTLENHADQLSPGVREALSNSAHLSNDAVLDARRTAALWRDRMTAVFAQVDVLLLPVMPCPVPMVGARSVDIEGVQERVGAALTRLSTPWSLAGLPAAAVPAGRDAGGAPIGMQLVARWGDEARLLGAAALLEELAGGPEPAVTR